MMNDFFDKVFLINLDCRPDRLEIADCYLKEEGIEYERFPAIKDDNGIKGLILTMRELFKMCLDKGYKNICVFEDDLKFLLPANPFLKEILPQLPKDYFCFHLGCNLISQPKRISQNILKIDKAYSTHSVAYSLAGMEFILPLLMRDEIKPYDILLMNDVQIHEKSYCTMPMLCTQRTDFSNIENRVIDWGTLMAMTFIMHTKQLQSMNEIAYCIGTHKINGFEIVVDPLRFDVQQNPELIGKVCDCRKFVFAGEEPCGCTTKEMRAVWKENTN